jgi:tRNA pseudouridine55 synthase
VSAASGLLIVDKPAGLTSHDVVARVRRLAGTRRVGHAGTLDPAATGVLVVGIEKATKLLGHLALTDKDYLATVRLGVATTTDDAEGEPLDGLGGVASSVAGLTEGDVRAAMAAFTGVIQQVPSSVSAIKVDGRRAYARVRDGEQVELAARTVTMSAFEALAFRRPRPELLDVDVRVSCSTGTYVRALARDLGAGLGVGGHLTELRRTRVGPYDLASATTLADLEELRASGGAGAELQVIALADAVTGSFPRVDVDAEVAAAVRHGKPVPLQAAAGEELKTGPHGVFGPDGEVLALMAPSDGALRALVVFAPA